MNSLRFFWSMTVALALCGSSCQPPEPAARTQRGAVAAPAPGAARAPEEPAALGSVVLLTAGAQAEERLPLVVVLHGLGDTPEAFLPVYQGLSVKARVVALRAPNAWGQGFSWFPMRTEDGWEQGFRGATERIASTITSLRRVHRSCTHTVVSGFSQGGMLSFALLARRDVVARALPIGGMLARSLWPRAQLGQGMPRSLVAFHGEADERVPFADARATTEAFTIAGIPATLRSWPGVGHTITPVMRLEILRELALALTRLGC